MNTFSDALLWRYATKKFDPTKKLTQEQVDYLMNAGRLAPTSFGLQPFKILVITDQKTKEQLSPAAFNQAQIIDSSAVFVLAANKSGLTAQDVDSFITLVSQTRGVPVDTLAGFRQTLLDFSTRATTEQQIEWIKKQLYIVLGVMMSAAAMSAIDSCPMEGFNPSEVDKVLGLEALGLTSAVLLSVGYRATDDTYSQAKKVRKPMNELFIPIPTPGEQK